MRAPGARCAGARLAHPSCAQEVGVALEVERPPVGSRYAVAHPLPALAVAVEVAVLELDARAVGGLRDEAHFDLAASVGVGLRLPVRADVPAEHDAVRRLVSEDTSPSALAPVDATVVDVAADSRLEHGLRDIDGEHVVLARLDAVEAIDEHLEGALYRRLHDD